MKFNRLIIFVVTIIISITVLGQGVKTKEYSIAKSALIIDSIENQLAISSDIERPNLIFDLAILYLKIDPSQSRTLAFNYLEIREIKK